MADLFKKLGVLIQSGLNDVIPDALNPAAPARRRVPPARLGKDIDREIAALRGRINEAVDYEARLIKRVQDLEAEMSRWDEQANAAVKRGDDAAARYAIDQMNRTEQRLEMADADLTEHRLVTQDLIRRVNLLDAVVADSRTASAQSGEGEPAAEQAPSSIADVLRTAREKIAGMGEARLPREHPDLDMPTDDAVIDDDLARRRQRLSKP
jgi:phage shock protein A